MTAASPSSAERVGAGGRVRLFEGLQARDDQVRELEDFERRVSRWRFHLVTRPWYQRHTYDFATGQL